MRKIYKGIPVNHFGDESAFLGENVANYHIYWLKYPFYQQSIAVILY